MGRTPTVLAREDETWLHQDGHTSGRVKVEGLGRWWHREYYSAETNAANQAVEKHGDGFGGSWSAAGVCVGTPTAKRGSC
eukprot:2789243-Rhodomonas_salina.3